MDDKELTEAEAGKILAAYKEETARRLTNNPDAILRMAVEHFATKDKNGEPIDKNELLYLLKIVIRGLLEEYLTSSEMTQEEYINAVNMLLQPYADGQKDLIEFIRDCNKRQIEENPDQPELFPPEEIQKTSHFTPRYAEEVKILTSLLARKLPDYANSDGDGQSHGELAINEKGNPVIQFDFNSDAVAITGRAFTRFDKQVHDAVCTLWGNGITEFYTDQVYKAMNRLPGDTDIKGVDLEAVENSLKAAVVRRITIDATEQFKKRYPKATIVKTAKWTDYLLPMRQIELTTKMGNVVNGWQISNPPAVFAYSDMLNQIATVPVKMLDTRRRVRNTPEVTLMRDKLTERIEWMKNDSSRKPSNTVLYSPLFAECGIDESSLNRAQIRRKRELVKGILDGFQDNGYIKGYTEEKSGQKLTGVKIEV